MAYRSTFAPPTFAYLAKPGALSPTKAIGNNSLAAWYWFDDLAADYEIIEINDSGGASFLNSAIHLDSGSGTLLYTQRNAAGGGITAFGTPVVGAWNHVALTWDGTTLRAYINGAQVDAQTGFPGGARGNWADLQIGPVNGELQDAVFYDAALDPEQVVQLYRARNPGRRNNLVIHCPIFPGSANWGRDYSGAGNDFANQGTPSASTGDPPQAGWGSGSMRQLYTDASGTPLPTAMGGDTLFDGAIAASKIANAAVGGDTLFGGIIAASKVVNAAVGGATLFGGTMDATKLRPAAVGGDTLFGGSIGSPVVTKFAAFGGATLFGGDTFSATGGGPPPGPGGQMVKLFRPYRRGR